MQLQKALAGMTLKYTHVCYLTEDIDKSIDALTAIGNRDLKKVDFAYGTYVMAELLDGYAAPDAGVVGALRVEIIEPKGDGNFYREHLDRFGPGLHHIGVLVPDFDRYLEAFTAAGCQMLLDMRPKASEAQDPPASEGAAAAGNFKLCYLDCAAIGFPTLELVGT